MTSSSPPLSDDEARLLREAGAAGLDDDAIEPAAENPDGRTLPAFQFGPSGELPGLGKVLAAIDPSVHPGTVARFFLTPTIDLESPAANGPLSPRDWLLASLPVDDVVLLARDL